MAKHTQTVRRQFGHFVNLALKGLMLLFVKPYIHKSYIHKLFVLFTSKLILKQIQELFTIVLKAVTLTKKKRWHKHAYMRHDADNNNFSVFIPSSAVLRFKLLVSLIGFKVRREDSAHHRPVYRPVLQFATNYPLPKE